MNFIIIEMLHSCSGKKINPIEVLKSNMHFSLFFVFGRCKCIVYLKSNEFPKRQKKRGSSSSSLCCCYFFFSYLILKLLLVLREWEIFILRCCLMPLLRLLFNEWSAYGSDYKKCPLCLLICTYAAPLICAFKEQMRWTIHIQWVSNVQPYASLNAFRVCVVFFMSLSLLFVCA